MKTALLLVDLQHDFLERPGLLPTVADITFPVSTTLAYARSSGMPVVHIRTRVAATGEDRMPHWRDNDIWECVAGTRGADTPEPFAARAREPVFHKQFFSGFGNPALDAWLRNAGIEALWVAGVYTHSCIRATVMDAYERGYRITVVADGVASIDPLHARVTRDYLDGRAARFAASAELVNAPPLEDVHFNPARPGEEVVRVLRTPADQVCAAVERARAAGAQWREHSLETRRQGLARFRAGLLTAESALIALMVRDLGKPRRDTADELRRALGHLDAALALTDREILEHGGAVVYQPHGVVAIITPWNNPVAIPVGKIGAALVLGNSVVWKPAFQADNISRLLLTLLQDSGLPADLLCLVNGGALEVCELAAHRHVDAVSLTGPEQAGRAVAAVCRPLGKPLQAELGGNNALLVLADADLPGQVAGWVRMAFGFAGQRCTALRRFVVEKTLVSQFEQLFAEAMESLGLANPELASCDVGPLISNTQLARVSAAVTAARARGARPVAVGQAGAASPGHYYPPTLLADLPADDPLVQEELFGPVAVVQVAEDFEHGLRLVNGVRQGLLAGIATTSAACHEAFLQRVEAGILIDGQGMSIHPAAPFGGRKASQIGPPEHGVWDRQFFSRVQTRYRGECR